MREAAVTFSNVWKSYPSYTHVTGGIKTFLFHLPQALKELYRRRTALEGLNFEIYKGENFGFIGHNGAGKSTTLGLIAGVLSPDKGKITVNGRVSPLLELGAGFHPELSGRANILLNGVLLGLTKQEVLDHQQAIIDFAELDEFIDMPVRTYSSGMYAKLGFAIVANLKPEILLLDEILAVGDIRFQEKCKAVFDKFRTNPDVTMILVSHGLENVEKVCDRAAWIENKTVKMIGPAKDVVKAYKKANGLDKSVRATTGNAAEQKAFSTLQEHSGEQGAVVIAGGAGFIGCHLARHVLNQGSRVLVLDNLCRGRQAFISDLPGSDRLSFQQLDVADVQATKAAIEAFHKLNPVHTVWHLAANSDIQAGNADPGIDLRDTFLTTHSLLAAMRDLDIRRLAFASSSAIYGDHGPEKKLCEDDGPLLPISNYGAMKLASEAAVSAAAETFLEQAWIFRFPNVVGTPATHGVILDFIRKLKTDPARLDVLGNGTQQKPYLHVSELVEAMLFIVANAREGVNILNIGPDDTGVSVRQIAEQVVEHVSPAAQIYYGEENRGWVGDVPKFAYSIARLQELGYSPQLDSLDAIRLAVSEIAEQESR